MPFIYLQMIFSKSDSVNVCLVVQRILLTLEKGDLSEEANSGTGVLQPCLVCSNRNSR